MKDVNSYMMRCSALSLDIGFKQAIDNWKSSNRCYIGNIHSIFERVVNIITVDGKLCSIAQESIDNGPYTVRVRVDSMHSFREASFGQGDAVTYSNGYLYLGEKAKIDLENVNLWRPKLKSAILHEKTGIEDNIKKLDDCILNYGGFGGIKYYYIKKFDVDLPNYRPTEIEKELANGIKVFLYSLTNKDYQEIVEATKNLIGLGVGLTPSGDDFLAGFIFITKKLARPVAALLERAIRNILEKETRTTDISYFMLMAACDGMIRENVENLIEGLFQEGDGLPEGIIYDALSMGSTSGLDLCIGILEGLLCCIKGR